MASAIERRRSRKTAEQTLKGVAKDPQHVLLIHYSCESFYDRPEGKTPRVTSIAVRNFHSGQTHSFSIHKIAEIEQVNAPDITEHYDRLERSMLDEFFTFVREHRTDRWVHWNMRDINYGFQAIEHRFRVLGGEPTQLDEYRKTDLARVLVPMYGIDYIGHPRLEKLMRRNAITDMAFLTGAQEAEAFDNHEFVKLHQSTLRKVDTIANILGRAIDGTLRTNASWWRVHTPDLAFAAEVLANHWIFVLLTFVAAVVAILGFVTDLFSKR